MKDFLAVLGDAVIGEGRSLRDRCVDRVVSDGVNYQDDRISVDHFFVGTFSKHYDATVSSESPVAGSDLDDDWDSNSRSLRCNCNEEEVR